MREGVSAVDERHCAILDGKAFAVGGLETMTLGYGAG